MCDVRVCSHERPLLPTVRPHWARPLRSVQSPTSCGPAASHGTAPAPAGPTGPILRQAPDRARWEARWAERRSRRWAWPGAARLNHGWGPGPGPPQFPHDLFACIQSRRLAVWPPASTGRSSAPSRGRHCGVSKNWGPTSAASGQHLVGPSSRPPQQSKKERMLWRQCLRLR